MGDTVRDQPTQSAQNGVPKHQHQKAYPNFSLRGKTYIVTGGGRGIGLVMAEAMIEAGAEG